MATFQAIIPFDRLVELPRFQTKKCESGIDPQNIIYLSAQGNYTLFHLKDGEQIITSLSLSVYVPLLEKHGFMRIHKSYLLNLHYLKQCRIHHYFSLTLPTGQILEIARRRRAIIKKTVRAYYNAKFSQ
ncbi:LytR/AlgR family response regulator transcription factor [Runella sp.]|uniref:LytR/AlgR family response regulator transcription factor n=1 Tax=Runella sp. TaxID=1960881 RepID=UPI003D0F1CF9